MTDRSDSDQDDVEQHPDTFGEDDVISPLSRRETLASAFAISGFDIFGTGGAGENDVLSDLRPPGENTQFIEDSEVDEDPAVEFMDDFDYSTDQLEENGWTIQNGNFEVRDSNLLGDAGGDPNRVRIYRDQPEAAGTFEILGIQNQAEFYGLRIAFISNAKTPRENTAGYQIIFKQARRGTVVFQTIDGETVEEFTIAEDHGGEKHDVGIRRDPETLEFTVYYDGEEKLTVADETITESTYWTMAYGGDLGTQRIGAVSFVPIPGRIPDGVEIETDLLAPGEPVLLSASGDDDVERFEWRLGDGTTATGDRIEHAFDEPGTYSVEVVGVGPRGRSSTTREVTITDDLAFTVDPEEPTTTDPVRFRGAGSDDVYAWDFGDGSFAVGQEVTHEYEDPGEYTVRLATSESLFDGIGGDVDFVSREISVSRPPVGIEAVDASPATLLGGIDSGLRISADLDATGVVEGVRVEHAGETFPATRVDPELPVDRYAVELPPSELDLTPGPNEFRVVASGSDGATDERTVSVPLYEQGANLSEILGTSSESVATRTSGSSDETPRTLDDPTLVGDTVTFEHRYLEFDYNLAPADVFVPENWPLSAVSVVKAAGLLVGEGTLDLNTGAFTVRSRSFLGINILGIGIEVRAEIGAQSTKDQFVRDLGITTFRIAGTGTPRSGPKLKFRPPRWVGVGTAEVGVDVRPGVNYKLEDFQSVFDGAPAIVPGDGFFDTHNHLSASTGVKVGKFDVEPSIDGFLHTAVDLQPLEPRKIQNLFAGLRPEGARGRLDGSFVFGQPPWQIKVKLSDLVSGALEFEVGTTRPEPDWSVFSSTVDSMALDVPGGGPDAGDDTGAGGAEDEPATLDTGDFELASPTGDNPPAGALVAGNDAVGLTRLTDRETIDTAPSVAARGDGHLAVWEAHRTGEPAETGRDIAVATDTGSGWSDRTYLTASDGRSSHQPALATDGARAVAAWVTYDLSAVDGLADLGPGGTLEVAVDDGSGWDDPMTVADGDDLERAPTVAPLDDGWVVAWERTPSFGADESAVEYAIVGDDGSVERTGEVTEAARPVLAADESGPTLVYHDRGAGRVRRDRITASGRTAVADYDAPSVTELAASASAVAWTVPADGTAPTLRAATGAGVDTVALGEGVRAVDDLGVVDTDAGPALTYRANSGGGPSRAYNYRIRAGGEWGSPQTLVTTGDERGGDGTLLTAWKSSVAADGDGLRLLLAVKPSGAENVADVFGARQSLRPNYVVEATVDERDVEPGTEVTVSYTVQNAGDVPGAGSFAVEAQSGGSTLATATESALGRGETTTGSLPVTIDESGTVDVVAAPDAAVLSRAAARTTVAVSTPALTVDDVSTTRPDDGSLQVTVAVANEGPVGSDPFEIAVRAGGETLVRSAVAAVPAGDTRTVTATVSTEALSAGAEEVVLDPTETLPDSHVRARSSPAVLGRPDLAVTEGIRYVNRGGETVADLSLTNRGSVPATVTVRAVRADATATADGFASADVYGTTTVRVPAAVGGIARSEAVSVALSSASEGAEVRYLFETDRPVEGGGLPALVDEVGPVYESTAGCRPAAYANAEGVVDSSGLREAIADWSGGDIDTDCLREVIQAWATGEPVT